MEYFYDPYILFPDRITAVSGKEARVVCPHPNHKGSDTNASFNMETGAYRCFGNCGYSTYYPSELVKWLRTICDIEAQIVYIPKVDLKTRNADRINYRDLVNKEIVKNGTKTHAYLSNRGITDETINEYQIKNYDEKGVIVPLKDVFGEVVGCNIRYTDGRKMRYQTLYKTERQPMFPMNRIESFSSQKPICVVEGMFGYFNAIQNNIQAFALLGDGGISQFDVLSKFSNVVLCLDNDSAGLGKMIKLFGNKGVRVAKPAEYDEIDSNSWLDNIENSVYFFRQAYDSFAYPEKISFEDALIQRRKYGVFRK